MFVMPGFNVMHVLACRSEVQDFRATGGGPGRFPCRCHGSGIGRGDLGLEGFLVMSYFWVGRCVLFGFPVYVWLLILQGGSQFLSVTRLSSSPLVERSLGCQDPRVQLMFLVLVLLEAQCAGRIHFAVDKGFSFGFLFWFGVRISVSVVVANTLSAWRMRMSLQDDSDVQEPEA